MNEREKIISEYLNQPERIRLDLREEVDSTNLLARQMGAQGTPEGYLAIADCQTAGRGRLGRTFQSPQGTGLYMSLLLRPDMPSCDTVRITTAAAVAVSEAVTELCGQEARIKWVNDIWLNDRKVCGILTESVLKNDCGKPDYAVLGIGVNLTEPEGGFDASIAGIAGALWKRGQAPENARERLAAAIVNRFLVYYGDLYNPEILSRYRAYSLMPGRMVEVYDTFAEKGDGRPAEALGIDDDFGLQVKYADGRVETLSTGEVSLRLK